MVFACIQKDAFKWNSKKPENETDKAKAKCYNRSAQNGMTNCVFCKIRDGVIKKEFDFEDKDIMVFPDINPSKPVHILVVPKKHMEDFVDLNEEKLLYKIKTTIDSVVKKNLKGKGYRVSVNGGGAQVIDHLHFHITGPIDKNISI